MKTIITTTLFLVIFNFSYSQKVLTSWSQQNIENYTKEMYDEAQKLSSTELLEKNLNDEYWSEVFLTLNASINHHSENIDYLKSLTEQLINRTETKLKGTSRLIIWDRITNGDIIFEGKGLVIENDLFLVAGRANQLLQNLTGKNFGYVTIHSNERELEVLKSHWNDYLNGKSVEEYIPIEYKNAEIPEISSLSALEALIISLQDNPIKERITKNCLKNIYGINEMPEEKDSPALYCNPDSYTFAYVGMLFGNAKKNENKDAKWWLQFWKENHNNLIWNSEKGIYEVIK